MYSPRATFGPVEGFVRPSFGFRCIISNLHADRAGLNEREAPSTLSATAWRFSCPAYLAAHTSETIGGDHVRRFVCGYLLKHKVVSQKNDIFATVTLRNNLFCHKFSDYLHCTNRPFTYVLRKDTSTLSPLKTYTV